MATKVTRMERLKRKYTKGHARTGVNGKLLMSPRWSVVRIFLSCIFYSDRTTVLDRFKSYTVPGTINSSEFLYANTVYKTPSISSTAGSQSKFGCRAKIFLSLTVIVLELSSPFSNKSHSMYVKLSKCTGKQMKHCGFKSANGYAKIKANINSFVLNFIQNTNTNR